MNEPFVQKPDHHAGFASHGSMNRVARKQIAQHCILTICWSTSNLITRVKIPHHHGYPLSFHERFDLLSQKWSDIFEFDVPRSVTLGRIGSEQFLAGALSYRDHCVRLYLHTLLQRGQKTL